MAHYTLEIVNRYPRGKNNRKKGQTSITHLSADELGLTTMHVMTMLLSTAVVVYLIVTVVMQQQQQRNNNSIHAAVLWIFAAAWLDILSSLLEMIHIRAYDKNGIGIYFVDAMAAHCAALCDAFLVLFLLLIAAGWTLPSDVIAVNTNESVIQKFVTNLANPLQQKTLSSSTSILTCAVLAFHVILAQWGRTYNDDFESYHALDHWPGQLLVMFRILCALLLIVATVQTRNKCKIRHLQSFYSTLAVVGTSWLISLPILGWFCSRFVPYYLRRPAVVFGAAVLQSSSLVLFAWLVTSHSTTYHQFSHLASSSSSKTNQQLSFTEALHSSASSSSGMSNNNGKGGTAEPRTWKMGKFKVRLD